MNHAFYGRTWHVLFNGLPFPYKYFDFSYISSVFYRPYYRKKMKSIHPCINNRSILLTFKLYLLWKKSCMYLKYDSLLSICDLNSNPYDIRYFITHLITRKEMKSMHPALTTAEFYWLLSCIWGMTYTLAGKPESN